MTIRRAGRANPAGMHFRPSLGDQKRASLASQQSMVTEHTSEAGKKHLAEFAETVKAKIPRVRRERDGRKLERDVNAEITQAARQFDNVKLWRNNRGQVMLPNGGRLTYGVGPNGASDFIGYRCLTITQEMVGSIVAQFLCVEAKRPGERATDEQALFNARIEADGGRSGVAHSGDEAIDIMLGKL